MRRDLNDRYGEKKLYEGGLSVRTTLDPKLQVIARKALVDGLVRFDESQGYRGAVAKVDLAGDWGTKVAEVKALADVAPWRLAVVLEGNDQSARIGLQPGREPSGAVSKERQIGLVPIEGVKWAKPAAGSDRFKAPSKVGNVLAPGDVVYVELVDKDAGKYRLRQIPEISGAMVVMDPWTGRVLALAGGFSFDQSQFNRATQALRQPGSSFKPFVYAAALDNGYTPSTVVMDAPIEIDQGPGAGIWKPENYSQEILRSADAALRPRAVAQRHDGAARAGRRHAADRRIRQALRRLRRSAAVSLVRARRRRDHGDAHGHRLFDVRQRRQAHQGDADRPHPGSLRQDDLSSTTSASARPAKPTKWTNQGEPKMIDRREQVIDPMTAYQITSMMEGVVQRGTATVVREVGKPVAGKTGTTNEEKDVWFIGFSPDLAVGVYHGLRQAAPHRPAARSGGHTAAPMVKDFLKARARRQAGGAVPRAVRHQADPHRSQDRHAARRGLGRRHPRSIQARHRAARQLRDRRLRRPEQPEPAAEPLVLLGVARCGPRGPARQRAVLIL